MSSVKFLHGRKKTREELRLPQQHFVAMDDWIKKIGSDAYVAWLTFFTWADRSNQDRETDSIPNSMNNVAKRLGVGKEKFYQKIIRPLWNYGFIDLQDIEVKSNLKENPVNIIVYEYPQNNPDLATKPLEQVRNYDTDYRPEERKEKSEQAKIPGSKIEPENEIVPSSKIEPGSSSKIEPGSSSKIELNNVKENNVLNNNVLNNNKRGIKNRTSTRKKDVPTLSVVVDLFQQHEIKINKATLTQWSRLADEHTILAAVTEAFERPGINNVIGYITKILRNGYVPAVHGSSSVSSKTKELPEYIKQQLEAGKQEVAATIDPTQQKEAFHLLLQLGEIKQEEYERKIREIEAHI